MDWSGMLPEVLAIIAQKHIVFYEDYHSFAGVCNSWHLAAIEGAKKHKFPNGPPSRYPSLMLPQKRKDKEFCELLLPFSNKNIHKKCIRKIRLPQINDKASMTSCGWLVTVGQDHAPQLVNPLSCETINLPKDDTIPSLIHATWYDDIQKLLLLTNNNDNQSSLVLPLVVILWGYRRQLGFWQPGDSKWTHVRRGCLSPAIYDFTYYDGKVYCFDYENHIRACDVQGKDTRVLVDVSTMPRNLYHETKVRLAYLIGLDDGERKRLLVIIREGMILNKHIRTNRFLVSAYDLKNKNWSKVKDLGTKALFVGEASFWIEEDTTKVIKGNCIYFTEDGYIAHDSSANGKARNMGIYHLSDETIEPYFNGRVTPPIWLQSI